MQHPETPESENQPRPLRANVTDLILKRDKILHQHLMAEFVVHYITFVSNLNDKLSYSNLYCA